MRIRCVGGVVLDDERRLLVVRRRNAPSAGLWSVPGGRVEAGETAADAVRRELREETGLDAEVGELLGVVDLPAGEDVFEVEDYRCSVPAGSEPRAGDDATDARFVTSAELHGLDVVPGLVDALATWRVVPD